MEQTRNKNGKFAKQYRFETRKEYENQLRKLELKLEDQADKLKDNEKDVRTQASLIAELQKKLHEGEKLYNSAMEVADENLRIIKFAMKFPIVRLAIWCKYGQ